MFSTDYATGGSQGSQEKLSWGGVSAAVMAAEGQEGPTVIALVGRCRGLRRPVLGSCPRSAKISMFSQDDLGQGPACSALAMDPKQMEVRGLRPLASNG